MILRAMRDGDRRRATPDRHRPKAAVGLGGQERRDGGRRRRDRLRAALGAPAGEQPPVALICPQRGRRERRGRVVLCARKLCVERGRRRQWNACWEESVGHG